MDCQICGLKSTQVQRCGDCGRVKCGDCAGSAIHDQESIRAFGRAKSPIASDHIVSAQSSFGTPVTSINGASNDQTRSGIETSATSSESRHISDQCHDARTPVWLSKKPDAAEQVNWTTPVVLPWYVRIGGSRKALDVHFICRV